jgi:predicted phage baseplate assembly protein
VIARHKPFRDLRAKLLRAASEPYLRLPGESASVNPLAQLDDETALGPVHALLEAWAVAGDVLTFYQERIAEEAALSTAREDRSAYWISRTVGHEPRPAISATTALAFAVTPPRPDRKTVSIPKGTPVGNVPPPGTMPAVFETSADLEAMPAWNLVPYALGEAPNPPRLAAGTTRLALRGAAPVAPGTALALRLRRAGGGVALVALIAAESTPDPVRDATLLRWQTRTAIQSGDELLEAVVLETRVRPFGALAPPFATASPQERRRYALGGVAVRANDVWSDPWKGLDADVVDVAVTVRGIYAITPLQLVRRPWGGAWTVSGGFSGTLRTIAATDDGRIALGTADGQVFISVDDGQTWLAMGDPAATGKLGRYEMRRLPALPVRSIAVDEGGETPLIFVATDRGVASIPLNGDAWTWRNDGFPGTDAKTGYASAAAMSLTFADAGGTLLAATTYGVYRSVRGDRWRRVTGLGAVAHVAALPGAMVAAGPGGIFRSTDGGATWERSRDVPGAPCCLAASVATVVTAVGIDVYVSGDGGETWVRREHALGEPVAAPGGDVVAAPVSAVAVAPDGTVVVAGPIVENPLPDWPELPEMVSGDTIRLDRELPLTAGDVLAISRQDSDSLAEAYEVRSSRVEMLARFGLAAMSTVVTLDRPVGSAFADQGGRANPRALLVHAGGPVRYGVPVSREAPAPPRDALAVPRGLPALPANRLVALEGRPPRVMLRAMAGGALKIVLGQPPTRYAWPDALPAPDQDVVAATPLGSLGLALARFDGVWMCPDVTAAAARWARQLPAPVAVTALAYRGETLYACGRGTAGRGSGVYALSGGVWSAGPELAGPIRGLAAGADGSLWAWGRHGLYENRGTWRAADPLFDKLQVAGVATDPNDGTVLAACGTDGVYARRRDAWTAVDGLEDYAVNAVALGGGFWYAGTRGAGLWRRPAAGSAGWTQLDAVARAADVRVLLPSGDGVLAAERGGDVAYAGVRPRTGGPLGAPLAGNVRAFVPVAAVPDPFVLAVTGVPRSPRGERARPVPMRLHVPASADRSALRLTEPEWRTLDAGMLAASLRSTLEQLLGMKLEGADVVVEETGQAWRVRVSDALPVFVLRRSPVPTGGSSIGADLFRIPLFELAQPPAAIPGRGKTAALRWPLLAGDDAPALLAERTDLWYAPSRADAVARSETATVRKHDAASIVLARPLTRAYDPATLTVAGNVIEASHGATIPSDEIVASGDSSRSNQTAVLAKKPLTNLLADGEPVPELSVWTRAATLATDPIASTAALAGRTADQEAVRWRRVPDFRHSTKKSRDYVVHQDADGGAVLTFGDAEKGRRLPSGTNNVIARYRTGGGTDGNVPPNALTLFQGALPGADRVRNPVAAAGGVPADRIADLRRDVSRGLISLGRIISWRDVKDHVLAWPGVAKTDVVRRRPGRGAFLVTFVERPGAAVDVPALLRDLERRGAAGWDIRIAACRRRRFFVAARLLIDDALLAGDVLTAARLSLADAFSFENRRLRDGVQVSAVTARLQRVDGVRAVVVDALYEAGAIRRVRDLPGEPEDPDTPAGLLVLDARDIELVPLRGGDAAGEP